jgi:hypothetical protein
MNKVLIGILTGAVLGLFDGATAWFTPEVRAQIVGIMIGSMIKGIIAGALAGWFARKVHSTAAGIAFGLAIGALLAFGVCQLQGGKYYFEIMLPGSIVGAIVGWVTQRYGRAARGAAAGALAMIMLVSLSAHAAEPLRATDAFAKLKSLDGTWNGHVHTVDGPAATVTYRVSAGGTAVMETLFGGTPYEMITMYTVDGNDVVATHYCGMGNQPSMKLNLAKSSASDLVFDFVALRGKGDHIHNGEIRFDGADKLTSTWQLTDEGGKEKGQPETFHLARAK